MTSKRKSAILGCYYSRRKSASVVALASFFVIPEGNLRLPLPLLVLRHSGTIRYVARLQPCHIDASPRGTSTKDPSPSKPPRTMYISMSVNLVSSTKDIYDYIAFGDYSAFGGNLALVAVGIWGISVALRSVRAAEKSAAGDIGYNEHTESVPAMHTSKITNEDHQNA